MEQLSSIVAAQTVDTCSPLQEPALRALLVTDLEEFTNLLDRTDDEYGRLVIQHHNRILRSCLSEHRGTESSHTGDGLIASFGHVDSAVRCAVAMQRAVDRLNRLGTLEPLHIRIGVHLGRPLVDDCRLFGKCVNTVFRVCGVACAGQIVVSEAIVKVHHSACFQFSRLGTRWLKGLSSPIDLYELEWGFAEE
jgi:class 3 adenylate cyclase